MTWTHSIIGFNQKTALPQFKEQITMRATIKVKYDFHLVMIMQHSHCVARIRKTNHPQQLMDEKMFLQVVHVKCMHGVRLGKALMKSVI